MTFVHSLLPLITGLSFLKGMRLILIMWSFTFRLNGFKDMKTYIMKNVIVHEEYGSKTTWVENNLADLIV